MTSNISTPIKWSSQLAIVLENATPSLRGDKIILPPSALEQLLSASTVTVPSSNQPQTSTFNSFNPYSYAAEQQAREQLVERRQELPHPLTFRLVNPGNGRICYAGIREFSAEEGFIGLSRFLRQSLGFEKDPLQDQKALPNGDGNYKSSPDTEDRLTIHVETLPKGTYVRLRPLEAGYDPEDWKSLLEKHLRENFTTLTNGELLTIVSGREEFRFLIDGLRPNDKAISLVDTDLEVDIEPLNEEQARETLKKRVQKAKRAPGTAEGSSPGGPVELERDIDGQVRPGEYVDYIVEEWDRKEDLEVDLTPIDDEQDIDLFVTPAGPKQRSRPREDEHVFADFSSSPSKRIKIKHTNTEMEDAEAIWISVRGYEHQDPASSASSLLPKTPIPYRLHITSTSNLQPPPTPPAPLTTEADEEICTNCAQPIPKRTLFLHQNFCLRNNTLCPHCRQIFQKSSPQWKNHWHCPHDPSHGNSPRSLEKHNRLYHTPQACPACSSSSSSSPSSSTSDPTTFPNVSEVSHHRTTICPSKPILCRFCHLQVPQRGGPDDPEIHDPEVLLSGLTPHELLDGSRTTECHLCAKIVRLRDMPTHLKHHDYERLSRAQPKICGNRCCGRIVVGYARDGKRVVHRDRGDGAGGAGGAGQAAASEGREAIPEPVPDRVREGVVPERGMQDREREYGARGCRRE
ncbi:MAG: hypothetical protein Q9216_006968 [Gyalolechia sp. 2 TL-2023]